MNLIFDSHLDLAMNAMEWNRDLRLPVQDIRERESGLTDLPDRSRGTVSFPAMRQGKVNLCVGTLISRYVKKGNPLPGWNSPEQAWAHMQGQLAWYRTMEECGELRAITNLQELENHLDDLEVEKENQSIGYILSMEGADSILSMTHLHELWEEGLRAIGLSHFGPGTYAWGTGVDGSITPKGKELLREMERLNIIMDVTHLSEKSFQEAMDIFNGKVWASHNNCRKFVDHPRQFTDEQIRELIQRDAVIGVVFDAWMLLPDWEKTSKNPLKENVSLEQVVNNIDHICQLAGDSRHVGIGSDLDGGYGTEQGSVEVDTIADLQKIPGILATSGYSQQDIAQIMHGNFIDFLRRVWE
ncbi:MAG: membrane dipeptidase [Bacteroidales bacterium]